MSLWGDLIANIKLCTFERKIEGKMLPEKSTAEHFNIDYTH